MLILCQEIQFSEGRASNLGMKRGFSELSMGKETIKLAHERNIDANKSLPTTVPSTQAVAESQTSPSVCTQVFRPTTPGHSPGVGHNLHN